MITDRGSGRSKGFAFVSYSTIEEAEKAREGMNAKFLDGWVIFVDPAKPREPRPPQQSQSQPSQTGFTVNKTVGWCGWWLKKLDWLFSCVEGNNNNNLRTILFSIANYTIKKFVLISDNWFLHFGHKALFLLFKILMSNWKLNAKFSLPVNFSL